MQSSRKFATMFLRVLLRAHVSGFNKWGTQLLVTQLADTSMLVATEALSVLSEATEDEVCSLPELAFILPLLFVVKFDSNALCY